MITIAGKSILKWVKLQSLVMRIVVKFNEENIAVWIEFGKIKWIKLFLIRKWFLPRVIQVYTKFANFTGLYFLRFTTFSNQSHCSFTHSKTLFLLAVVSHGFRSSCLDQNLVYSWNHPLPTHENLQLLWTFPWVVSREEFLLAFDLLSFVFQRRSTIGSQRAETLL